MSTIVALVVTTHADAGRPLVPVGGVPMVVRAVRAAGGRGVARVVLLVPDDRRAEYERACSAEPVTVHAVETGRPEPVRRALFGDGSHGGQRSDPRPGDDPPDVVVIHEADRPLAPPALVAAVVAAARAGHPVVVPVLPLTDTVKTVAADGRLLGTPDRTALRVAQTPVALHTGLLDGPLRGVAGGVLDVVRECAARGVPVHPVPGDPLAFPLRSAWDLERAGLLLHIGAGAS